MLPGLLLSEGPSGYVVWRGVAWLPATQIQLVGLTAFCLETTNQSTANGTQPKVGWQTCIVTADAWLGHQNVSFKAKAVLPYSMGRLRVCGSQRWSSFITR